MWKKKEEKKRTIKILKIIYARVKGTMFAGKVLADVSGTADNCTVVSRAHFAEEPSMSWMIQGEVAGAFLKSRQEEHIFTNLAYIRIAGNSATSKKRFIQRFDYVQNAISDVCFETAGIGIGLTGGDKDVELKFTIGRHNFSIDIVKSEIEIAKPLYRALVDISRIQQQNADRLAMALSLAGKVYLQSPDSASTGLSIAVVDAVNAISDRFVKISFGDVFDRNQT